MSISLKVIALGTIASLSMLSAATAQQTYVRSQEKSPEHSSATEITKQCYSTAITYQPRCVEKKVVQTEDCFCSEVPVKTSYGTIKMKVKCSEFRFKAVSEIKVKAEDCNKITKLPKLARN